MSLFLYDKAVCPHCRETFRLRPVQRVAHVVRLGNRKLMRCPRCKRLGLCKGQWERQSRR